MTTAILPLPQVFSVFDQRRNFFLRPIPALAQKLGDLNLFG
jgi:hypothetical protein